MRRIALFMCLTMIGFSFTLLAENEEQKTSQSEEASTNTKGVVKKSKRKQVKTLEEFIPSEEVSADKAVAFPSDI